MLIDDVEGYKEYYNELISAGYDKRHEDEYYICMILDDIYCQLNDADKKIIDEWKIKEGNKLWSCK